MSLQFCVLRKRSQLIQIRRPDLPPSTDSSVFGAPRRQTRDSKGCPVLASALAGCDTAPTRAALPRATTRRLATPPSTATPQAPFPPGPARLHASGRQPQFRRTLPATVGLQGDYRAGLQPRSPIGRLRRFLRTTADGLRPLLCGKLTCQV